MASTSRNARVVPSQEEDQVVKIDQQVRAILNYILCHSAHKVPIKHNDLVPMTDGKNELNARLPIVSKLLEERYGVKLIRLEGTPKRYICVAESPVASMYELTPAQRPQYSMLYIILAYIFLRGSRVEEEKLYIMLDMLGVNVHEEHGYFGDNIAKLIEDTFVKQLYLKRERSQMSPYDEPKISYTWGLRAKAEFSHRQVVEFASKLLGQDPVAFQHQLMIAEGTENVEISQRDTSALNKTNTSYIDVNTESENVMDADSQ